QFALLYQPVVALETALPAGPQALTRSRLAGFEAQPRWPHLERGMIAPARFIPLAERTGRIVALDRWAIAAAVKQTAGWSGSGWNGWVSINLSAASLHDAGLAHYLVDCLQQNGVVPSRIVVEITEDDALRDITITQRVLGELKDAGVVIALDNFGVGHSSLAHLKRLPIDLLKLDQSFVSEICLDPGFEQFVDLMIAMAHRVGAKAVAEGVEFEDQLEWLRTAGCDLVQGTLLGEAEPAEALEPVSWTDRPQPD
ncbi:MAG: EAL domain-containing protein, partial [Longimicrobiales bacterium]